MEDIIYSHNLGKGIKKGTPDYELSPTSKSRLLADAVGSTVGAVKGFGRQSINPKTGKPYTKSDFKQTTLDTSKINNESGAQLYWDDANLQKFIESGDKDMKLSDVIGTQGMHSARRFNEFQDHRDVMINEYNKSGDLDNTNVASRQTMDRTTGDITYDDVEYEEEVTEDNPNFNPEEPESEENPKTITKTVTKTRAFDPENDKTEFDKARDNTKDYSTTDLLVNSDADVTKLVRTGPEANPNVIDLDNNLTNLEIEDYDPENSYTDNRTVIKKTSEEVKKEKREGTDNNVEIWLGISPPPVNPANEFTSPKGVVYGDNSPPDGDNKWQAQYKDMVQKSSLCTTGGTGDNGDNTFASYCTQKGKKVSLDFATGGTWSGLLFQKFFDHSALFCSSVKITVRIRSFNKL